MDANGDEPRCERCGRPASVHITNCEIGPSGEKRTTAAYFCKQCAPPQDVYHGDIDEIRRRFSEAVHPIPIAGGTRNRAALNLGADPER